MYAALLTLAVAAAPADDRHAATRQTEAHRALQAEHLKARTAASELYHYATHRLDLEREVTQRMVSDVGEAVEAGAAHFGALRESLTPGQREAAASELQLIAEWHGRAGAAVGSLKNEVAEAAPDGREIRFHSSAAYGAVASAEEAHGRLLARLNVKLAERVTPRAR